MKWEYHTITLIAEKKAPGEYVIGESHVRELDGLGSEGWELVSVVPMMQDGVLHEVTYVLKRPLQPSRWK